MPRAARSVGYALRALGSSVPWQRLRHGAPVGGAAAPAAQEAGAVNRSSATMPPLMSKGSKRETNASVLKQAMLRRLPRRMQGKGEMSVPPVPALVEHYVKLFDQIWEGMGRKFSAVELDEFRKSLLLRLEQAYQASPSARVVVSYETDPAPKLSLTWKVVALAGSYAEEYQHWVRTRTPPLFGKNADAKAVDVARSLGDPSRVAILDVGAGTGRNTLALAREGFVVDALEAAPALCQLLRDAVSAEGLALGIVEGDILDVGLELPRSEYSMLLLSEVVASHFRSAEQVKQLFQSASRWLVPGGLLVFNAFLTDAGYEPEDAARQLSEVMWSVIFTRRELDVAIQGLPFERVGDERAAEYEKAHLPEGQYPSTGWYEGWSEGQDLFDLPADLVPIALRWLTYRKVG